MSRTASTRRSGLTMAGALLKALRNEMRQKELHEAILQERLRRMVDNNEARHQPAEHDGAPGGDADAARSDQPRAS
ncbi:MAG: hypothetical protein WED00_13735 [Aquisalimonadaceae bacterium]